MRAACRVVPHLNLVTGKLDIWLVEDVWRDDGSVACFVGRSVRMEEYKEGGSLGTPTWTIDAESASILVSDLMRTTGKTRETVQAEVALKLTEQWLDDMRKVTFGLVQAMTAPKVTLDAKVSQK